MNRSVKRYWAFQIIGWGTFALINIFFAFLFNMFSERFLYRLIFYIEIGIIFTHLMREAIHKMGLVMKSLQQQIFIFIILAVVFDLFLVAVQTPFELICGLLSKEKMQEPLHWRFLTNFTSSMPLLFIWNLIYFMYHYVEKSRKQQMDTIKLEALVKELELKTIKAHINPHFIFNALNSIRALIDENPSRARKAVTELSNILRSSLQAEKGETVSFQEELKIVKDYLALEHMRFEDRLQVDYEVDDATLTQPVPPMMLQTLVENAIKHGISKQMQGGMVKIHSGNRGSYHELVIQNTGHLNGGATSGGFGLSSTQDRLSLLYGDRARFEIKQASPTLVEAKVLIPLSNQ
ncbi:MULTISPECIES: sensor histidine kinase [Chitinophagaceae]|uniref:sensor histidine kinase n=1 Tax=Chitinophagaceae TaxID=563835 RepID=UPI000DEF9B43|nr:MULTISPECIES: histidine kinase [Chitinophagaceae]RPD47466.1 sensor histidine kinase [Paracnuella aquatica]